MVLAGVVRMSRLGLASILNDVNLWGMDIQLKFRNARRAQLAQHDQHTLGKERKFYSEGLFDFAFDSNSITKRLLRQVEDSPNIPVPEFLAGINQMVLDGQSLSELNWVLGQMENKLVPTIKYGKVHLPADTLSVDQQKILGLCAAKIAYLKEGLQSLKSPKAF